MIRKQDGREVFDALLNWDKGPAPAERLAGAILGTDGFESIDPSHPLGGPDGGKDILLKKDGDQLVAAVYFPRGQKSFGEIKTKFVDDSEGIKKNEASGIVFFTNQELRLAERKELRDSVPDYLVEIYHLERLSQLFHLPLNYGIRLEFLQIEMSQEETMAFLAQRDFEHLAKLNELNLKLESSAEEINNYTTGGDSYPLIFLGPLIPNKGIPYFCKVNGNYPLYDLKISFQYTYSGEQKRELLEAGIENTKIERSEQQDWTNCGVLTAAYTQLITHLPAPLVYPAGVQTQIYARNFVFTQTCLIQEGNIFSKIRVSNNKGVELMNHEGEYLASFNSGSERN